MHMSQSSPNVPKHVPPSAGDRNSSTVMSTSILSVACEELECRIRSLISLDPFPTRDSCSSSSPWKGDTSLISSPLSGPAEVTIEDRGRMLAGVGPRCNRECMLHSLEKKKDLLEDAELERRRGLRSQAIGLAPRPELRFVPGEK